MNQKQKEFFDKIYNENFHEIKSYIKVVAYWNQQDAYDILQETFLVAIKKISILMKHENVTGWLKQTARYECLKHFEKNHKIDEFLADEEMIKQNLRFEDSHDDLLLHDLRQAVTKEEYKVIVAYFLEGYSVREIASFEQITEEATRSRFRRGRKKAKKQLFMLMIFG